VHDTELSVEAPEMTPSGRFPGTKVTPESLDPNAALLLSTTTQKPLVASDPGTHDTDLIAPGKLTPCVFRVSHVAPPSRVLGVVVTADPAKQKTDEVHDTALTA
jgi:hypothetical protein